MIERIVDTKQVDPEKVESTRRPQDFSQYIGQATIKRNLLVAIAADKKRQDAVDHLLLHGAPGLGKTTLAGVIAKAMATDIKVTSGPAIEGAGDLASIMTNLAEGDILFID